MQCVLFYGRVLSRAVANGIYNVGSAASPLPNNSQQQQVSTNTSSSPPSIEPTSNRFTLLTAVSGFPKNHGPGRVRPGKFGDDAYFVAKHQLGDVIGKYYKVYIDVYFSTVYILSFTYYLLLLNCTFKINNI